MFAWECKARTPEGTAPWIYEVLPVFPRRKVRVSTPDHPVKGTSSGNYKIAALRSEASYLERGFSAFFLRN